MSEIVRLAWERWQTIGQVYGNFQGRLFAVLFYFTLFAPFALGVRLFGDPLHIRRLPQRWHTKAPVGTSLEDARRQF